MRARVVHLTSAHSARDVRIFHKECRSLAQEGYDVTLIARHTANEVVQGVKIVAVPGHKSRLGRITRTVWRMYREAARLNADVYHFHDPDLIPVGVWLSLRGKRAIYDAHEDLSNTFPYKYYIPAFARRVLAWVAGAVEHLAARRLTGIIAATPVIATKLRSHNSNTIVVRNFPLLEEFARRPGPKWRNRPSLIVYVGNIAPERGFREAITAMSLLPPKLNAQLAFAGSFTPQLCEEALHLAGSERTDLLGRLDRREVGALLRRAKAGLVLLHPMPNFVNALPVKLFEYMSAGVPVVASDFPLWREIIESSGCGLLVDPLNINAIAQALEYLLTHPEEAEQMGARGRAAIETRYNWKTEEQQLLSFYKSMLPVATP